MGIAYLGIGVGGAIVPLLAAWLTARLGWRASLQVIGVLIVAIALPMAYFVREKPPDARDARSRSAADVDRASGSIRDILRAPAFYLLALGSMCSIAAVGGTNQHLKLFLSASIASTRRRTPRDHLVRPGGEHRGAAADGMAGGPACRGKW